MIWLCSSVLALVLLAAGTRGRSPSVWLSVGLLWFGIVTGALAVLGVVQQTAIIAALATLTGCTVGGTATFKSAIARMRGYFILVFVLVVSMLLLPAELGSLSYYVLSAFHLGVDVGRSWEMLEMQLWYTASPLIPFLYAGFLFSWIWAPLLAKIPWKSKLVTRSNGAGKTTSLTKRRFWLVAMGCFGALAAFIGYYPYFRDPAYPLVGTDIYWRNALPAERVLSSTSWLVAAAKERHPIIVLGIAVASKLSGLGVESLLRLVYIGLILVLGFAIFLLVFIASRNRALASLSALASAASMSTTVGMYTGAISNWIALILWIMTLTALAVRNYNLRQRFVSIFGLTVGSLAVLFIHPWTWVAVIVGLIAYCVIVLVARPKGCFREVGSVLLVVLLNACRFGVELVCALESAGLASSRCILAGARFLR